MWSRSGKRGDLWAGLGNLAGFRECRAFRFSIVCFRFVLELAVPRSVHLRLAASQTGRRKRVKY